MRANNLLRAIVVIAAVAVVLFFGRGVALRLPEFAAWVKMLGPWGPAAFILGYALAAVVMAPAFLLTIAGGAIWGLAFGLLYVMLGATLGAVVAFLVSRHFVRRFVEQYVLRHPRLAAIDRAVEKEGMRLVFLLRLSPIVSYVLLNYALGVSRVRFRDYLLGSFGMIPTALGYVYAGKLVGDVAAVASGAATPRTPLWYVSLVIGLIATVVASVLIARAANKAINDVA